MFFLLFMNIHLCLYKYSTVHVHKYIYIIILYTHGERPVNIAERAGVHDGVDVHELTNTIPSSANPSKLGVFAYEPGYALIESCLCWSAIINITFGGISLKFTLIFNITVNNININNIFNLCLVGKNFRDKI